MMQPRKGSESKIQNLKSKITRHRPKLGQHFLHDQGYRNKILEALPLEADDVVIEIGPGRGAMTALLAGRARRVIAIELDRALAQGLQEEFPEESRVQVIPADVLRVDFAALCRQAEVEQAFVFGNLPYYITSPILHHLFAQRDAIRSMGLLMQREVAERLTAEPGTRDYGYFCRLLLPPNIRRAEKPNRLMLHNAQSATWNQRRLMVSHLGLLPARLRHPPARTPDPDRVSQTARQLWRGARSRPITPN